MVWTLLLVTGSYLLFGKVPESLASKPYYKSRRIMGITFFIYALQFFLQWKFNARDLYPLAASALNVTIFYLASVTMGLSFISLLNRGYLNRKRVICELSVCFMVAAAVWGGIFFLPEKFALGLLIVAAIWLFVYVGHLSWVFCRTYLASIKKIQNYYSDEIDSFIRWMSKSVFFAILMGLLCSTMAFAPKWMICLYLILSILFFYYIFSCFLDYMIDFETVEEAIAEEKSVLGSLVTGEPESEDDKLRNHQQLEEAIRQWVADKGYLRNKVTMGELARQMNTNRSYLSGYINSNYSCTFRKWIADLRIEEAKILLLEESGLTVAQVAEEAGFSTSSHFITLFTEKEKLSPAKWREEKGKK